MISMMANRVKAIIAVVVLVHLLHRQPTHGAVTTTLPTPHSIFSTVELERNQACKLKATKCETYHNVTCLGSPLPYTKMSFELTGLQRIGEVYGDLKEWTILKNVPKCWHLIQPLLCSVYFPKCDSNGYLELPNRQLCRVTRGPCRIVLEWSGWPDYLQCNNTTIYRTGCDEMPLSRATTELKFGALNATCPPTLVPTDREESYFHSYDGCSLPCENPLYTEEDLDFFRNYEAFIVFLGALLSGLLLLSNIISTRTQGKSESYPESIIVFLGLCYFWVLITLFATSMIKSLREQVTCESDGTRRLYASNMWCLLVFLNLYVPGLSFCIWYCLLSYCWCSKIAMNPGVTKQAWEKKNPYFHMIAWGVPFVISVLLVALNTVEAETVSGVCFISTSNLLYNTLAIVLPLVLTLVISMWYNLWTICAFISLHRAAPTPSGSSATLDYGSNVNYKSKPLFRKYVLKILITLISFIFFTFYTIFYVFYTHYKRDAYNTALKSRIHCLARKTSQLFESYESCQLKEKPYPTVAMLQISFIVVLGGIMLFIWHSYEDTLSVWKMCLQNPSTCFHREYVKKESKVHKIKKHKVIQQVYQERYRLQEAGKLSLSLQSVSSFKPKPIDMQFMRHSSLGTELSETFAAYIPRLVMRRGAVPNIEDPREQFQRQTSFDTRSVSNYKLSIDKRCHSIDSLRSLEPFELDYLRSLYASKSSKRRMGSKSTFFEKLASKPSKKRRDRMRRWSFTSRNSANSSSAPPSRILPAVTLDPLQLASYASSSSISTLGAFALPPGNAFEMQLLAQRNAKSTGLHEFLQQQNMSNICSNHETSGSMPAKEIELEQEDPAPVPYMRPTTNASVQTSMTDLSLVGTLKTADNSPQGKVTTGTQYDEPNKLSNCTEAARATAETSSYQNEVKPLHPLEPNVIRISVPHPSSEDTSSIPSSYEVGIGGALSMLTLAGEGRREKFHTSSEVPLVHHRGRRGGLVSGEGINVVSSSRLIDGQELSTPRLIESSSTS